MIKSMLQKLVPESYRTFRRNYLVGKQFREWQQQGYGYPVPAHRLVKETLIHQYQKQYGYRIFVETGTCHGHMVQAQLDRFDRIYSIELDQALHQAAVQKFADRQHVHLLQGDSGKVLAQVLNKLEQPAIFWLDAHFSGGVTAKGDKNTPVIEEVEMILEQQHLDHVILIDDARSFYRIKDYPTVQALVERVKQKAPRYRFKLNDDCIQFFV